ncbi:MAG: hypothetical protein WCK76_04775 [Elusimicrobiota bacterium]
MTAFSKGLRTGAICAASYAVLASAALFISPGLMLIPAALAIPLMLVLGWRCGEAEGRYGWSKALLTGLAPALPVCLTGLLFNLLGYLCVVNKTYPYGLNMRTEDTLGMAFLAGMLLVAVPLAAATGGVLRNLYFTLTSAEPAPAAQEKAAGEGGEKTAGSAWLPLLAFLPFFTLLGAAFVVTGGLLYMIVLGWWEGPGFLYMALFLLAAGGSIFAFYKFQQFRQRRAAGEFWGMSTLLMAGIFYFAGLLSGAQLWPFPPRNDWETQFEARKKACADEALKTLTVWNVSDSQEPGSGYINFKADMLATKPLMVSAGPWINFGPNQAALHFIPEMPKTGLQPGVTVQAEIHVVVNPVYTGIPPLSEDGPYLIPELSAYVGDCSVPVIKNYRTKAYKASDFKALLWSSTSTMSFPPSAERPPAK